jgi:hypothetical protein
MHRYKAFNAAMPTTAPPSAVATGTATKTMLQLATPSTREIQLISWGYTLSGLPGATGTIELIQTDVAATVTAHVASGLVQLDPNAPNSLLTLGTAATGYSASVEGTPTATRLLDADQIPATAGEVMVNYDYQWMPDERPIIAVSKFLRVRATTPTSGVNMLTWVCWDE